MLIDVLRGRRERRVLLAGMVQRGHRLATAAINIAEVYAGMRDPERARTEQFLSTVDCYPITAAIARRAGNLKRTSAQKGRTLTLADMLVAATAIEHDVALLTDNRKDFALPDLKLCPLS